MTPQMDTPEERRAGWMVLGLLTTVALVLATKPLAGGSGMRDMLLAIAPFAITALVAIAARRAGLLSVRQFRAVLFGAALAYLAGSLYLAVLDPIGVA